MQRPMRYTNEKVARLMLPVVIGAACTFALASAVNAVTEMTGTAPRVGDIVAFAATQIPLVDGATQLIGRRIGQSECLLDLEILQRAGGSFIIESEVAGAPGTFLVHWAGRRTAEARANCGADASLLMDTRDLDTLAASAGGYGAGKKWTHAYVPDFDK
jgi:hypothetical protein